MRIILKKILLKLVLVFLILTAGVTLTTRIADAAESTELDAATQAAIPTSSLNLTLSPVSLNLIAKPGETISVPIKIRNNGNETESLNVSYGTFTADKTGQHPVLLDPKPGDDFLQWLSVDEPHFTVSPGEWKTVKVRFSPPSEAALSYYYTLMFNRERSSANPGQTTIRGVPAMLVLTTVTSPNTKKSLTVDSFVATSPLLEFLPEKFQINIKNTGNVHVAPTGNIFINGQGHDDLAVLSINPGNSTVLPQSTRTFEIPWNDGFPVRQENRKLDWNFANLNHLRFGKYTAHLLMVYDNGERDVPIESSLTFWVVPWRLLFGLILIPIFPALVVYMMMRWSFQHQKQKRE